MSKVIPVKKNSRKNCIFFNSAGYETKISNEWKIENWNFVLVSTYILETLECSNHLRHLSKQFE